VFLSHYNLMAKKI